MNSERVLLDKIKQNVNQLIDQNTTLKSKCKALEEHLNAKNSELQLKEVEITNLKNISSTTESSKQLPINVDELVKEIDDCIFLLKNEQ